MGYMMSTVLTETEKNLRRYYQTLMEDSGDIPDISDYDSFGDYLPADVVLEMASAYLNGGVPAVNAYIASLSEMEDPEYKRIVKILSDNPLEAVYAGTLLSDVTPQKIPWLWYPRLALGKITTLDGDPGLGKSLIGADLGARVTTGEEMPDGAPCRFKGGVVVIMPEDTLEDTIQPRFARAGADLSKVVDLSTVKTDDGEESKRPFQLLGDLDYLEAAIRRVNAKLVYIDPIMALVGKSTNANQDDDVRKMLLPLKMLVEKLQVACVIVRHMTKTRSENPLMAGQGSIAFIGVARTGLTVVKNPHDKSQMILSHIKSNIGPLAPDIAYTICNDVASGDERPYLVFTASSDESKNETKLITPERTTAPRTRTRK